MSGKWAMFYDPIRKKDMPINVDLVTHAYADKDVDGKPTCAVVMVGNSLILTVQGDIVDVYAALRNPS